MVARSCTAGWEAAAAAAGVRWGVSKFDITRQYLNETLDSNNSGCSDCSSSLVSVLYSFWSSLIEEISSLIEEIMPRLRC